LPQWQKKPARRSPQPTKSFGSVWARARSV